MYLECIGSSITMGNQKTDTIDRNQTSTSNNTITSNNTTRRSSAPPSWSELANRVNQKFNLGSFGAKTIGYMAAALTLGFGTSFLLSFAIPGSWLMSVFLVSLAGSLVSEGDYLSSGLAGAAILGVSSLLSGFFVALMTVGFTVLAASAFGAIAGVAGTAIGKKLTN